MIDTAGTGADAAILPRLSRKLRRRGFAAARIRRGVTLRCDGVAQLFEFHQANTERYVANLVDRRGALRSSGAVACAITRATITVLSVQPRDPCRTIPRYPRRAGPTAASAPTAAINRPGAASLNNGDAARRPR